MSYQDRDEGVVVDLAGRPPGRSGGPEDQGRRRTAHRKHRRDVLRGGPASERISGADGGDVVQGGGGDDVLSGGRYDEADYIDGGEGDDDLEGGTRDTLLGSAGDDLMDGGARGRPRRGDRGCGAEDLLRPVPEGDFLPGDCERLGLRSSARPSLASSTATRDSISPSARTTRSRAGYASRSARWAGASSRAVPSGRGGANVRVTAVVTAVERVVLRDRATPLHIGVAFRRASCRGDYGPAGRFEALL